MTKIHFRPYNPNQTVLFPQRIDEDIAENDPVRMVDALVKGLNLESFRKLYPQIRNYAPNMIQKRKESASLVKRGHSASNVTIKTYKCPYPTMRLEAIRKITTISCRCYPKSFWNTLA